MLQLSINPLRLRAQLEVLALVDLPPNKVTPKYLGLWAKEKGEKHGFNVIVLDREAAKLKV
jgi:leucyl aminopeptidase